MALSIGIVGLPNVGKSTLFNALVKARQAEVASFPFTTIDKNVGIVEVPDPRLSQIANRLSLNKIIPATVKFIDIAGLVKNAHRGEGLGNQFLSHIRETDVICLVLRCFEDSNVAHVSGKIDPKEDLEIIKTELELADLQTTEKQKNPSTSLRAGAETKKQKNSTPLNLLSHKLIIYVANVSEKDASLSPEEIIKKYNLGGLIADRQSLIVISAKVEQDLIDLSPEEQKEYLESLGLKSSGLDRLIQVAYKTLGLITYYTLKPGQVQAWSLRRGETALRASGKIHTDFAKGFIKANVISYEDYLKYNGEQGARTAGKLRQEGKDYIMQDGDVVEFLFNV